MSNFNKSLMVLLFALASSLLSATVYGQRLRSVWAPAPPDVDGNIMYPEWGESEADRLQLPRGLLLARNDAAYLYLLLDLTGDTADDPPLRQKPWGDFISITFDVNGDGRLTPGVDLLYGMYPLEYRLGVSHYIGPRSVSGIRTTRAKLGASFAPSINSSEPHRIWEVGVPLGEVRVGPGKSVRIGIEAHSQTPRFMDVYPSGFKDDFSKLIEVELAVQP